MDWQASDWLGVYGAILASVLGLIQWQQWRTTKNALVIVNTSIYEFGRADAATTDLEFTMTNKSGLNIFVHACWAGYSLRRWKSPWRREIIHAFQATKLEGDYIGSDSASYFEMAPGNRAELHVRRSELGDLEKPSLWSGFGRKICIAIDHTASQQPVFMFDL